MYWVEGTKEMIDFVLFCAGIAMLACAYAAIKD